MLLAAGLGERLRPLTLSTPKPLIPVGRHLLMEYNLSLLKKFGAREVMINLHHLGEKMKGVLGDGQAYGLKFHYSEEPSILGTGGGMKAVEAFWEGKDFFALNGDVLLDVDLGKVWEAHQSSRSLATLVLSPAERKDVKRLVYLDEAGRVLSISEKPPREGARGYVFTGVQVLSPSVLAQLPASQKSCIVEDAYLPLIQQGQAISGFVCDAYFRDLGTPERYEAVKREFEKGWPYTTLKPEEMAS